MITKATARDIYNCYQQLDEIGKLREEMSKEIEQQRKRREEATEPIPENDFGRFGHGCQLGVPDGFSSSMRIFNISPETAVSVIDEQEKQLKEKLERLRAIASLEMGKR